MSEGDPNPWPAGIADTTWAFRNSCLELGGNDAGIYADKPGFHNNVKNNQAKWPSNYSVNPAYPVLTQGPQDKARAFDWLFPEAQKGDYGRITHYSKLLLAASKALDPRLTCLYEWFGTDNGANIGYGVYKNVPSSSDDSHDYHIHFSFVTASLLDPAGPRGVASVLRQESLGDYTARGGTFIGGVTVSLTPKQDRVLSNAYQVGYEMAHEHDPIKWVQNVDDPGGFTEYPNLPLQRARRTEEKLDQLLARPVEITLTDEQVIALGETIAASMSGAVMEKMARACEAAAAVLREDV